MGLQFEGPFKLPPFGRMLIKPFAHVLGKILSSNETLKVLRLIYRAYQDVLYHLYI